MEQSAASEFDEQAREDVRQALMRYMRAHAIGAPAMQTRIMDADSRERELPLSTLQRFLRGSHRTNDSYVAMCAQFLSSLEPAPQAIQDRFSEALAGFFGQQPQGEGALTQERASAFAGNYQRVSVKGELASGPSLTLALESAPGRSFMRATETLSPPGEEGPRYLYEGAMVGMGGLLFLTLKNALTHLPKIYWLEQLQTEEGFNEVYLMGQMSETLFREEGPDGNPVLNENITIEGKR